MPLRRLFLVVLLSFLPALPAHADGTPLSAMGGAESGVPSPQHEPGAAGIRIASLGEGWTWCGSQMEQDSGLEGLARLAKRLGDLRVVGPALLAGYVSGRIAGLPDISAASARVAGATVGAAVVCGGLKLAVGQGLPGGARGSANDLRVFGGREAAFPSGHTTVAFAAASAIDAETQARWVPWVAYGAAGAVGVAQSRDAGHGIASVTGGAVLGLWAGRKLDEVARGKVPLLERARFLVRGTPRDFRLGFKARF